MQKSRTYITIEQKDFLEQLHEKARADYCQGEVPIKPKNMPDHRLLAAGKKNGLWSCRFTRDSNRQVFMYYVRPLVKIVPFVPE